MKQDDGFESEEAMRAVYLRAARRTRASSAAVAIIVISAIGCCVFRFAVERSPQALQGIFLLGFLGVALLIMERAVRPQEASDVRILQFYKSPRFYGTVMIISSGLVLIFAFVTSPLPVTARIFKRPNAQPPPPLPEPAVVKPPEFPILDVAGVILSGSRSSALINGRTVLVGEFINDVKLVEVREDSVVVELQGFKKSVQRNLPRTSSGAATSHR